ncbi:MAG TPA: hypothetical protein VHD81_07810 [Mycobacteriales bacterium]|nr:hypothetical protein [Mycobacteriales bacterium]
MRDGLRRAILVVTAAAGAAVAVPAGANTPNFAPYHAPTFHCPAVHHYGNGVGPKPGTLNGTTLCVIYNKRDITADNGGAVRFSFAEPGRFAVAGKCQYWQRDHWRIRVDRGFGTIVSWDGSYWWDLRNGYGGAVLRNFKVGGLPVGAYQAAAVVSTVSPPLAAQMRRYGGRNGGFGAEVTMPSGIGC